ncbi:CAMP-independent regulatory protein pac2 [Colletotrichum shisoi]|uniref:cAMP-independent regulatory protein pac2 n=1 Tax=Colletotrichum shisoi TaxID=2078593 RepID=A0A5Q4BPX0_9PEZI|nr:CAMP-independent regulatory protein pac2 [Colletotrichum shisoi]
METYHGFVRTPADAIKLFEACRLGLLPRVQRRLSEKERQSIRSGSVFVWDEREAGMRRWTDGKSWSASRVSGSFLTYREMEGKRGSGFGGGRRGAGKTPDSGRGSDEDQEDGEPEGYRYKADGLMKQSFSITTSTGQHLHLISYYSRPHPGSPELQQPSTDPQLRHITPMKGMYPESSLHESNPTPALTRGPMLQQTTYMAQQQQQQQQQQHHQQPMPPQAYPPQYAQQQGYSWPPSPVATPPYSHYTTSPYPPQQHQQPPQHQLPPPQAPSHPSAQPPHYAHPPPPAHAHSHTHAHAHAHAHAPHHLSPYDRAPLPPPTTTPYAPQRQSPRLAHVQQPQHHSPRLASIQQPRAPESPRISHLQAQAAQAAQAVMDPRLGPRNNSNTLPGINAVSSAPSTSHPLTHTPPNRTLSVSPPRSSHSETNGVVPLPNKASLSALLLHPTPSSSEASSANLNGINSINSANSSPRTGGALGGLPPPVDRPANMSHDVKALQALDRKFCI